MSRYQKKLVLTFTDRGGRLRKFSIPNFLEDINPSEFARHMNQSLVFAQQIDATNNSRQLRTCLHAHKVEISHHDILSP